MFVYDYMIINLLSQYPDLLRNEDLKNFSPAMIYFIDIKQLSEEQKKDLINIKIC
jgi:hypothetical protein